jgi:hypothetical protein
LKGFDWEITRLQDYEITRLRDYEITRLQDYKITKFLVQNVKNTEGPFSSNVNRNVSRCWDEITSSFFLNNSVTNSVKWSFLSF